MAMKKDTKDSGPVDFIKITQGRVKMHLLGNTPLILHRMSEKAKHELLLPKGRKSTVEKATTLKHNPIEEYRDSCYLLDDGPTRLGILTTSFKKAMMTAALDMPGAKKAQIGRLTYVMGDYVSIYGTPKLHMATVRMADMNRTPDIRTRAIVPQWACEIDVSYTVPLITPQACANLVAAAGVCVGVGDWRLEKGGGNFGLFSLVDPTDPEYLAVKEQARDAQVAALEDPVPYDHETADLLAWFDEEVDRRRARGSASTTEVRV